MCPPGVLPIPEGFGGTCGFEQSAAQPRCIAPLKIEDLAEYPALCRPRGCNGFKQ